MDVHEGDVPHPPVYITEKWDGTTMQAMEISQLWWMKSGSKIGCMNICALWLYIPSYIHIWNLICVCIYIWYVKHPANIQIQLPITCCNNFQRFFTVPCLYTKSSPPTLGTVEMRCLEATAKHIFKRIDQWGCATHLGGFGRFKTPEKLEVGRGRFEQCSRAPWFGCLI